MLFWSGVLTRVALSAMPAATSHIPGRFLVLDYLGKAAIGALLLGAMNGPGLVAGMILEARAVRFIGRLSYSLYLWQQPFLWPSGWTDHVPFVVTVPVCFLFVFGAALVSYFAVEKPFLAMRDRWMVARRPSPSDVVAKT